jgi:hypothetical protein
MISHDYKCIFIHIRKNAGSSIISSFAATTMQVADRGYGMNGALDPSWDSSVYSEYLIFAVSRNPWSRFISGWKWLCARPYPVPAALGPEYYRRNSLKNILKELPGRLPTISHDRRHLFWTHLDMLTDKDGQFLPKLILRFENLEADYENKATNRPYWDYYDPETREMVGEIFRRDIEYFGYKFGE